MLQMRACLILTFLMPMNPGAASPAAIPEGTYELVSRLELPHVERWAVDQTTKTCLAATVNADAIPIPVLSTNNPFAKCAAVNVVADSAFIEYDILCPGRESAKAHARYVLDHGGFTGRVTMVMAAKNMTMTEVVRARRLGECQAQHRDTEGDRFTDGA
jgi:Protein of unknown function (DUF3617)